MASFRLAALALVVLLVSSCDNGVPGGGPLTHSTLLPSVQGGYTGTTLALTGAVTFTMVGNHLNGDMTLTFPNTVSAPPASFTSTMSISGTFDSATRTVSYAGSDAFFDTGTGWSDDDDFSGVVTINPDRTFTVTLHLVSAHHWEPVSGGGFVDHTWTFDVVYTGTHDPGA